MKEFVISKRSWIYVFWINGMFDLGIKVIIGKHGSSFNIGLYCGVFGIKLFHISKDLVHEDPT